MNRSEKQPGIGDSRYFSFPAPDCRLFLKLLSSRFKPVRRPIRSLSATMRPENSPNRMHFRKNLTIPTWNRRS